MPDEMTSMLELPPSARALARLRSAYRRFSYEVRHPENHKQLVRFLCVGASGYAVNLVSFFILVHPLQAADKLAFVLAAVVASTNNFFWNRHWTFQAKHDHPGRQAVRFFFVSLLVLLFATGIYTLLVHSVGISQHTLADGIAWIIATPLSFVVQKLWSFKA
ncbi:MAG TPA: GtrA family protein [Solirubrobacteraceae bacterium]|nr:GtrA family protein [Solirubrobacteraceae bacterium]